MEDKTIEFLLKVNDLQKTNRYGNYPPFIESTSEHTFKLVLMIDYFYKELQLDLDYKKCIQIALYHDFGEMDLKQDVDIKEDTKKDMHKFRKSYEQEKVQELSESYYSPIKEYYDEYEEKQTEESLFVNACDKLEAIIHPLSVNEEIMNHELFAVFADKAMLNFPKLMPIYKQLKEMIKGRFLEWGFEWKEKYDSVFETYARKRKNSN